MTDQLRDEVAEILYARVHPNYGPSIEWIDVVPNTKAAFLHHADAVIALVRERDAGEVERLRVRHSLFHDLLYSSFYALVDSRPFITSSEQMAPIGVELWDKLTKDIEAAIAQQAQEKAGE